MSQNESEVSKTPTGRSLILIAEDDPNDRVLLQRTIARAGVESRVQYVDDGAQAVSYLRGEPPFEDRLSHPLPSLLILDLKMPRLDGIEVVRWIRGNEEFRRLRAIILTSSRHPVDITRAYDAGVNAFLSKPISIAEFVTTVRRIYEFWIQLAVAPELGPSNCAVA